MSALQKLAVGRDVGTSRPASAGAVSNKKGQSSNGCSQRQQTPLHPLLQSLDLGLPANLQTAAQQFNNPQQNSSSSSSNVKQVHGAPPATAQSAAAAAALAQALKHNPALLLDGGSAQQLLASLAANQQQHQLNAPQQSGLIALKQQLQGANTKPAAAVIGNISSNNNCGSGASAVLAPFSQQQQQTARPVTPHATKPYKPGTIKQPPQAGRLDQAASTGQSQRSKLQPHAVQEAAAANQNRPSTAASAGKSGPQQQDLAQQRPQTAGAIRPGSAAASRLLRSIDHKHAWGSRLGIAAGSAALDCTNHRSNQQQHQQHEEPCSQEGTSPVNTSSNGTSSQAAPDTGPQTGQQQQEVPKEQNSSRPSTAFMRALLLSRSGADAGVLERLAWYQRINSSNDSKEGLDIVNEEDEAEDTTAEDVPEWLAAGPASPAAAQAGPMVLNLEDLTQSTPEVLEHELDGLTYDQLQQLKQLLDGSS